MASTPATGTHKPKLYVLHYYYTADALEKRKLVREGHLANLRKQVEDGNLVLAGPVGDPPTAGILIFRNLSSDEIEQFAQQDPYTSKGVVDKYTINPYIAVFGDPALDNDLIKIV